jgi:hypothetical protein
MKGKTSRPRRNGPDYAMMAAIVAIILSVAVILGISYRYAGRSEPNHDVATRMNSPFARQPAEL